MYHSDRRFRTAQMPSFLAMAQALSKRSWTLCSGFTHGHVLMLNDSFSADSLQEYAVFYLPTPLTAENLAHRQSATYRILGDFPCIDSFTVSWMEVDELLKHFTEIDAGKYTREFQRVQRVHTHAKTDYCSRCA